MGTLVDVLHLLAAAVWTGGTVALVFVGVPAIRSLEGEPRAIAMRRLGRRWRPIGWSAMAVLIVTGALNADEHHVNRSLLLDTSWGRVLLAKSILLVLLVAGALAHDFVLGPRLQRQIRAGAPQSARLPLVVVGWTNFALTVTIPVLGVVLARMGGH